MAVFGQHKCSFAKAAGAKSYCLQSHGSGGLAQRALYESAHQLLKAVSLHPILPAMLFSSTGLSAARDWHGTCIIYCERLRA